MKKKNMIIIGALIIVLAGGTYAMKSGLLTGSTSKDQSSLAAAKIVSINAVKPVMEQRNVSMSYKATLEPAREAIVSSQSSGKVIQVMFENDQPVSAGAALVQIDDRDAKSQLKIAAAQLQAAKATLQKIEASLKNTRINFERTQSLYSQGVVSQAELDSLQSALDMLTADQAAAEAGIQTAQGNMEFRQNALNNMTIRASIDGIMDSKAVKIGQSITPDGVLGRIKDISQVDAVFEINQDIISDVKVGQKADLWLQGAADKIFQGKVSSVDLSADPASRVFKAKVRVANPTGELRPGVFAWVKLTADRQTAVITLPVELISGKEGTYSVFVNENGVARKKLVMLGEVTDNRVEVKMGIGPNDQIISTNLSTLQDGDAVTISVK